MNKVLVLLVSLGLSQATPVEQTVIFNEDGSYRFNFDTGKDAGSIVRHEERQADGTVIGRYSYEDPTGSVRVVNYRAGRQGFVATGDVGVAGAPPAQVPAQLPPETPVQEEPHQDLQLTPEPDAPQKPVEPEKHDDPTEEPPVTPAKSETPIPDDEPIKVAIPEEPGRKREAGAPPTSYSDNFFPFAAPMFGKRRLDVPDEEDKSAIEDDTDKNGVKPPTSYIHPYDNSPRPAPVQPVKPAPVAKPIDYYYYVPVAPQFGFYPGSQPAPQPAVPQFHTGQPKAWAYVPVSAFQQQNAVVPQQGGPATNWLLIHPHAVNYVPGGVTETQKPDQIAEVPPVRPTSQGDPGSQVFTSPVQSGPTRIPEDTSSTATPEQNPAVKVDQGQFHPGFQRPTVHHYHFRGPSHTYGYYYQY